MEEIKNGSYIKKGVYRRYYEKWSIDGDAERFEIHDYKDGKLYRKEIWDVKNAKTVEKKII